jgi:hypothetical protein
VRLPDQVPVRALSSVAAPSFSVQVVPAAPAAPAAIRRVPAPPQALLAFLQAAVLCIPPAPRLAARRVAVPASANAQVGPVAVPGSVPVPAALLALAADLSRLRVRRRVPSVRVVRHADVDASNTRRPKKAR